MYVHKLDFKLLVITEAHNNQHSHSACVLYIMCGRTN